MNLSGQIELITNPQEFVRLCNAALLAVHGTDFLPVDDDRPDRGNDGYLKSEKRLIAMHCFKRIQNRGIDGNIRTKMTSDLAKAIQLKAEGQWEIAAWTFLSNYPIPEAIGKDILLAGKKAGIDVSWQGPNYLADILQQARSLRSGFPDLQVNEIMDQLESITANLKTGAPNTAPQTLGPSNGSIQAGTINAGIINIRHSAPGSRRTSYRAGTVCLLAVVLLGAFIAAFAPGLTSQDRKPGAPAITAAPGSARPTVKPQATIPTVRPSPTTSQKPNITQVVYYRELRSGYAISSIQDPNTIPVPIVYGQIQDITYQYSITPITAYGSYLAPLAGKPSYLACAHDTAHKFAIPVYTPLFCYQSTRLPIVAAIQILNWSDFTEGHTATPPYTLRLLITVWEKT